MTRKVPVIFHSLRGYDSQLVFDKLIRFDVKIDQMGKKNTCHDF